MAEGISSFENGRFAVVCELGRGGMGVVYLAEEMPLRRPVVIKTPLAGLARHDAVIDRFAQEACVMARAGHAGVVKLFGTGIEPLPDGTYIPYIVMDLFRGVPLDAVCISREDSADPFGPLSPSLAARILLPALYTLADLHEVGVIHRDVKPSNLMVGWNPTRALPGGYVVRLMDFGIARVVVEGDSDLARQTKTMLNMHTIGYSAPEQQHNTKLADARADIYAAAATLYAMVTGTDPWDLHIANRTDHTDFRAVPECLREVILGATRYRPEERTYQTMRAFADAVAVATFGLDAPDEAKFRAWLAACRDRSPLERALRERFGETNVPCRETAEWACAVSSARTVEVSVPGPVVERGYSRRAAGLAAVFSGVVGLLAGMTLYGVAIAPTSESVEPIAVESTPSAVGTPTPVPPIERTPESAITPVPVQTPRASPTPRPVVTPTQTPVPAASPTPVAEATPTSTPVPTPDVRATVRVAGGDRNLVLLVSGTGGEYAVPGRVPPGEYRIKVTFDGEKQPSVAGSVSVSAGQTLTVTCFKQFRNCKTE